MPPNNSDYLEIAYQRSIEKKTHVSFPQLKYPSQRDEGLKHPVQWLEGKELDDGAEGLWRVHDGIYDLSEFIDKHPGGKEWLELSKGTDITEAFECHHFNPTVETHLQKYYVRNAKTPRNSPFTFKEDGFYKTLKGAVREELKKIPPHVARYADFITDGLLATALLTSAIMCSSKNYWVVMISYFAASLSLAWLVIASHNYIHRKDNWRMYLFNFGLWSYRDFRISHVLSHHVYPNTLMDLEISAFEPLLFLNPRRDKPFYAKFSILIQSVLFPLLFVMSYLKRLVFIFNTKSRRTETLKWHDFVGFILPLWMYLVSGTTITHAFVSWFWILCTGSLILAVIGTTAAHHHPKIFKDGDEVREPTIDWGMHELEAVMDRTDITGNLFKVMTFFGDHALHHLFPTLDHAILNHLYPVFLDHVKKFRANFRMTSSLDLMIGQIQSTLKKEPNTLQDKAT